MTYNNIQTVYSAMAVTNAVNERGSGSRSSPMLSSRTQRIGLSWIKILQSVYEIDAYGNKNVLEGDVCAGLLALHRGR